MSESTTQLQVGKQNIKKIKSWMEGSHVDLVFLCDPPNVKYVIGTGAYNTRTMFESSLSELVLIDQDRELPTLIVNPAYRAYYVDREASLFDRIGVYSDLPRLLRKLKSPRNIVASRETPERYLLQLRRCFHRAIVQADSSALEKLRSIKDQLELECVRQAAKIAMSAMKRAQEACLEGRKECEVAADIDREIRALGADTYAFSTIVSSGVNAGIMWEVASEKIINRGELVMIDLGATKNCYNSEFTRTFPVGHIDSKLVEFYRVVTKALEASVEVARAGTKAGDVDKAARDIVKQAGHNWEFFTGHGVGTAVWEPPIIGPGSRLVLRPNMIIALEPGIYVPKVGGVRLEQNLLITKGKPEVLTPFPLVKEFP